MIEGSVPAGGWLSRLHGLKVLSGDLCFVANNGILAGLSPFFDEGVAYCCCC